MSGQPNNPHDVRLTELFENQDAFISLLKDCVKADWIDDLDTDSLKRSNTSFILQDFAEKEADIIYEATLNNGSHKVIFYVLLEMQSTVDYRMPYRLLLYVVEILRHYYNHSDVNERERADFKFPAVVPIVFYNGKDRWTVPTNLREMFYGHSRFGDSLIDFNYSLIDAKGYDDESVKDFQSRLLKVMMMFERSESVAELIEVIEKYRDEIESLNDEELRIISAAIKILSNLYGTEATEKIIELIQAKHAERVSGMLVDLIANEKRREQEWIRQAKVEAKIEAAKETAKTFLEMGLTVEQVAKGTRLTIEEVEKIKKELDS